MKPICKATNSDQEIKKSDKINQKKITKPTRKIKKKMKKRTKPKMTRQYQEAFAIEISEFFISKH